MMAVPVYFVRPDPEGPLYIRQDLADDLFGALEETWRVLRLAGLHNLTRGVQLGQTSWFVKISDAERMSDLAIERAKGPSA